MLHTNANAARCAVVIQLLLITTTARGQQTPTLEVTPDTVLTDQRFRLAVAGLSPGKEITIRVDGNRGVWHSNATFRSDERGRVDVPDPATFLWSAASDRPGRGPLGAAIQPWVFTAELEGRVIAADTLWRRAVASNVRVVPLRERGLVGAAYYPTDSGPHPAMIVLPGSNGGIPGPAAYPGGLASRGYVVLALAYFNAPGLPPLLQEIPLEYFATAVDWLKSQPSVDSTRIGLLGTSRGGELALLLGATYPSAFRVVVANVPSSVVWGGLGDDSEKPAWTLNGEPVPGMTGRLSRADMTLRTRDRYLRRLQDRRVAEHAAIAVERIEGALLLFSAKDDQVWPSDVFAERVVDRLKARGFTHPVEHYTYEHAGHAIARPFVSTAGVREVRLHPITRRPITTGGTPEGQARADEDSWEKLLAFLDRYLKG
jgi:dienelactone hydrolase